MTEHGITTNGDIALSAEGVHLYYGQVEALKGVTMTMPRRRITALIGPSGCGKSTFLRCFNRMNDVIEGVRVDGVLTVDGEDINRPEVDLERLRKRVGMVFQKSNPFPMSIRDNITFGPRMAGIGDRARLAEILERSLKQADLLGEVKDRLDGSALDLSGGQQQRLCIARAIAMQPEVLLMDEPCSALDPIATARIEDLIDRLKSQYTVVLVTHNMQQAARVSDRTAFMLMGELVEVDATSRLFTTPGDARTQDYITGRFG